MSNPMKNAKVFNLPLRVEYDPVGDSWIILDASGKVLFCPDNEDQAEAIVRSINEYDKLKAELKEAKELLQKKQFTVKELLKLILSTHKEIDDFLNKEDK